ncbi:GDSL-type esterase/lipase family protein [Demequina sp. NBRC 110051]|uniref:GDSL-type esterase/lipase family protein n=1 Tax=Demequina sp. NBRC 110051 TaxID=1570340 RepID=UPI00135639E6|nr:GDSL-type esterase/lipase family protein [Demequina sp. NBRC 110051]
MRRVAILVAAMMASPLVACAPEPPTAVFVGDAAALVAPTNAPSWVDSVSASQGWTEINAGCSDSGYTQRGTVCMATFREQLPALVPDEPDVVVVSGGVSDLDATPGEIRAAVRATYLEARETFPDATIYAVAGLATGPSDAVSVLDDAVAEAATSVGAIYVDVSEPLTDPTLMADDGSLTAAGHAAVAELTSNVISAE